MIVISQTFWVFGVQLILVLCFVFSWWLQKSPPSAPLSAGDVSHNASSKVLSHPQLHFVQNEPQVVGFLPLVMIRMNHSIYPHATQKWV